MTEPPTLKHEFISVLILNSFLLLGSLGPLKLSEVSAECTDFLSCFPLSHKVTLSHSGLTPWVLMVSASTVSLHGFHFYFPL